ncbi:MAG: FAD-dependent oxidoreductase [Burkholderiales bacterium]
MKKLVLLGGGHAHVEVLRQFGLRPMADVEITLVSPDRYTPYSGMLPGLVAGHYDFDDAHIDLEPLARFAGARFLQTSATAIAPAQRNVTLADGSALDYGAVSIDVGSTPPAQGIAGAGEHAMPVKPVKDFLVAWEALIARVRDGSVRSLAMVGGGAAGVEVLLAMYYRLAQLNGSHNLRYVLVTDTPQLLANHARGVRATLTCHLALKQVEVHCATRIGRLEANTLITESGSRIAADAIFLATGASAPPWLAASGLALNGRKFININKYLQSTNHIEVFAAGDCATITNEVYPKSGVYAVRQGPPLAENLRRFLLGESLIEYTPQSRTLALISTGDPHAIASWGGLSFHGHWVWRWKDRIDRAFMAKYRNLKR